MAARGARRPGRPRATRRHAPGSRRATAAAQDQQDLRPADAIDAATHAAQHQQDLRSPTPSTPPRTRHSISRTCAQPTPSTPPRGRRRPQANARADTTPEASAEHGIAWRTIAIGIAVSLLALGDRRHHQPHAPHLACPHQRVTQHRPGVPATTPTPRARRRLSRPVLESRSRRLIAPSEQPVNSADPAVTTPATRDAATSARVRCRQARAPKRRRHRALSEETPRRLSNVSNWCIGASMRFVEARHIGLGRIAAVLGHPDRGDGFGQRDRVCWTTRPSHRRSEAGMSSGSSESPRPTGEIARMGDVRRRPDGDGRQG